MKPTDRQGLFEVIDSFAIRNRNQFYLIGKIKEGEIEENWFVNIPFNSSLSMLLKINCIEEIEMASEKEPYTLLIVDCDDEAIDLFMALIVGPEYLPVTINGED
jgi:tmRNA-binding protein